MRTRIFAAVLSPELDVGATMQQGDQRKRNERIRECEREKGRKEREREEERGRREEREKERKGKREK